MGIFREYAVDLIGNAIWLYDAVAVYGYLDDDGYDQRVCQYRGAAGPIKDVIVCSLEINRGIPGQFDWVVDGYGNRYQAQCCLLVLGAKLSVPLNGWRGENWNENFD